MPTKTGDCRAEVQDLARVVEYMAALRDYSVMLAMLERGPSKSVDNVKKDSKSRLSH